MAAADANPPRLAEGWDAIERDDLRAAEDLARRALAEDARDGEALRLLGASLLFQDRFQEALAPLREAHQRAPRKGSGHRLGFCYLALGDLESAARVLAREVGEYPDLANARNALGVALVRQSRREEALAVFTEAARLDPASAEANTNVGNVLAELGRHAEAIAYLQRAAQASPELADAHFNLGLVQQRLRRHTEAIASLRRAAELAPRMPYALSQRIWSELAICNWQGIEARIEQLRRQVRDEAIPASPFAFVAATDDPAEQRRCAELHVARTLPGRPAPLWQGERYRHERIRIAYLSADFREHPVAHLVAGLCERHDRARFEIVALSYGPDDASPMRARIARAVDRFVDARPLADEQAARLLRDMEIDIAVDLMGHTTDARPGILAHRPAPIQATWLGYPGTTAAPGVDYVLADRVVLPEAAQHHWSEKVLYLPECVMPSDDSLPIAPHTPARAAASLPPQGFVFCSFNNSYKITPRVFDVWTRLLRAIDGSVLWLRDDGAEARRNLEREAAARGVDAACLVFAPRVPLADYMARHRLADLFLDTLPYNAHTGASDALRAGLPVLTCTGRSFAGRVATSLLHAVGLPELATRTLADYEALALRLARNPGELATLRERLAASVPGAAPFDTDRFRRGLEAAYVALWQARPQA